LGTLEMVKNLAEEASVYEEQSVGILVSDE
jgi:hypothetical protein